jgi:hypothetical protein
MFIVLYRWRVKPHLERQFIESWSEITDYLRKNYDSLGSRLHRGSDELFYGYAQWKSDEDRKNAFTNYNAEISEASLKMRESIDESFSEIVLESIADYLV